MFSEGKRNPQVVEVTTLDTLAYDPAAIEVRRRNGAVRRDQRQRDRS